MRAKFQIGDKVRFTNRICKYIAQDLRHRTRTIVDSYYDSTDQCVYYRLGIRGDPHCEQGFGFRSYMLYPVNEQGHTIGRPRRKKRYFQREHRLRRAIVEFLRSNNYKVKPEVKLGNRFADFVASKNGYKIALELKWKDWRYALHQALAYKPFVSDAYIVLPHSTALKLTVDTILRQGIGLIRINWKSGQISLIAYPNPVAKEKLLSPASSQNLGEYKGN